MTPTELGQLAAYLDHMRIIERAVNKCRADYTTNPVPPIDLVKEACSPESLAVWRDKIPELKTASENECLIALLRSMGTDDPEYDENYKEP